MKAYCDDLETVAKRLMTMGAVKCGSMNQVDTYFVHPSRNFADTDEALRVRVEDGKCTLTYKGPKLDFTTKTREEIEVVISDCKLLVELLVRLGFRPLREVIKERTVFSKNSLTICLDRVEGLGDFVEIEYSGTNLDKGKEEISSMMNELNLRRNERRSYLELLLLADSLRK